MPHFEPLTPAEWATLAQADDDQTTLPSFGALRARANAWLKKLAPRVPLWAIGPLRREICALIRATAVAGDKKNTPNLD